MSTNPQDVQTPGDTEPDEPGEIGWPANADRPGDPSIPQPGTGGAGPHDPLGTAQTAVDVPAIPDPAVEVPAAALPPVVIERPEEARPTEQEVAATLAVDAPGTVTT